ncbi:hypothetical protein ACWD3I_20040 [Streptomyces sp. NPDC002817]|uniref:hypothetical protein n=1 Tax=Streptomyces sp. NPDC088357 TaxID=3154655 RepID=UPI0034399251
MLASDGGTGDELRGFLLIVLWLLPITAGLCAVSCGVFFGAGRRLRAAGETYAATAKARNAVATGMLAVFLAACWGAAALMVQ